MEDFNIKELPDAEIAKEYARRFMEDKERFRRALCDMFNIGYFTHTTDELLEMIKNRIQ